MLDEIDWNIAGIVAIMYVICLALIWKFFDQEIMRLHVRIIMTIIMLPVCYFLTAWIAGRD